MSQLSNCKGGGWFQALQGALVSNTNYEDWLSLKDRRQKLQKVFVFAISHWFILFLLFSFFIKRVAVFPLAVRSLVSLAAAFWAGCKSSPSCKCWAY